MKHPSILFLGMTAWLVLSLGGGAAAPANPAGSHPSQSTQPIAWTDLGAKATAQYSGDGLAVTATDSGVRLRCVFQQLEGEVTPEGLRLSSTSENSSTTPLRVLAASVGRERGAHCTLPSTGTVERTSSIARCFRPGLIEEYSVSVDGVWQDFVLPERLPGGGALRVELALSGATAEASSDGVRLVLEGSRRKLNYHRLRATDATGRELAARMEVVSTTQRAVMVEDGGAVYPVRIDPTFSDANWLASERPGVNGSVAAAVVDCSGILYIGGQFTWAGGVEATNVAKWDGSSWSALGTGTQINGEVFALAVLGNDLYAGGFFTTAGGVVTRNIAKWNGSAWTALGSGLDGGTVYQGVRALAASGGDLYAAGEYLEVVVDEYDIYYYYFGCVSKWNGSSWIALALGFDGSVQALAASGSDLYAGFQFTTASGVAANIAKWNGSSWSALGSGMTGGQFYPRVYALAVSGDDLYAAGHFANADGVAANHIAKWNGGSWSAIGSGLNGVSSVVYEVAVAASGAELYAGGDFTSAGGKLSPHAARASLPGIPPLPSVTIRLTAPNSVTISWPSAATGFVLQQNINGAGSVNWSNVTNANQNEGTTKTFVVNPAESRFYRLVKP